MNTQQLIAYLEKRAQEKRTEETTSCHYGAGMNSGLAIGFELAADWLRSALRYEEVTK